MIVINSTHIVKKGAYAPFDHSVMISFKLKGILLVT